MPNITVDHFISLFFALGLGQVIWFSLMLSRRNIAWASIRQAATPLLAIWVLAWPIYEQQIWAWFPISLLLLLGILSSLLKQHIWQHLGHIWGQKDPKGKRKPWPLLSLLAALSIALAFFQRIPEFGLGLGLTACLAFPFAQLLEKSSYSRLHFPLHPEQSLLGHLGMMGISVLLCSWSIHLYHGIDWRQLLIATLIAAMGASIARASLPSLLHLPAAILTMGGILWLL